MRLKTPSFWYGRGSSVFPALLSPASFLYDLGRRLALHKARLAFKSTIPVLCVGNLVAGGSGKTPVALALSGLLTRSGLAHTPCFLSRGYGGRVDGPALVDPAIHNAADTGDEPLLLARAAPVIVARDRAAGARLAQERGFDVLIMDDGLQNRLLVKTVSLAVVDAASGFGNGRLLPAGPLRMPLQEGFALADAFIVLHPSASRHPGEGRDPPFGFPAGKTVFHATLTTSWQPDPTRSYIAFCGLGRPAKFFDMLRSLNAKLIAAHAFPDHHSYNASDLVRLAQQANSATLLTTEKDAARLPPDFIATHNIEIVRVAVEWQDEPALLAFLRARLRP